MDSIDEEETEENLGFVRKKNIVDFNAHSNETILKHGSEKNSPFYAAQ